MEAVSDDDFISKFRFQKRDVYRLQNALGFPNEITCHFYNDLRVESTEVLCILLNRLACPCRYADMVPLFGRAPPQLSMIFNFIDINWGHLLQYFNQGWLSRPCLQTFSDSTYRRGAALDNVWGFLDGTVRPICRPKVQQRILYNGHKRFHALKFQSVTTPSGMIANLYGPAEGRRHDCALLAMSNLLQDLRQFSYDVNDQVLCLFGDPAYPIWRHLQSPFCGVHLNQQQRDFNKSMSQVRVTVEWVFGDVINYFKHMDFKKNL